MKLLLPDNTLQVPDLFKNHRNGFVIIAYNLKFKGILFVTILTNTPVLKII